MGILQNLDSAWPENITQIETTDPVEGGPAGIDNQPHRQLASRTAYLKAALDAIATTISGLAAKVHKHVVGDVEGLDEALGGRSLVEHGHDIPDVAGLSDALAARHKTSGNEVHQGKFKVTGVPTEAMDVLRKMDLGSLLASEITVGAGSTEDSGYALFGAMVLAWVKGPSTWCTGNLNPLVTIQTPITFDRVLTYALSTEDSEEIIYDNDMWFQMTKAVTSGNTFPTILQFKGGAGGGWARPVLHVWGIPAAHTPTITTGDWTGMAANGQTFPRLVNIQLAATGGLGSTTWEIVPGGTATASFLPGYPSIVQVSIPAVGAYSLNVRATDSTGASVTKTLNITLAAYSQTPLSIATGNQGIIADVYPLAVSVPLTASGGDAPITWAIVAGAGTTLPSAAVSGSTLTGSAPDAGSYTVQVRATDSSATPQVVDKTLTIAVTTYEEPPDVVNPCFEDSETYVLMGDWSGKLFADVVPGELAMGIKESRHERGKRLLQPTHIMSISRLPGTGEEEASVIVQGVKATPGHPYGTIRGDRGDWTRARELESTCLLVGIQDRLPVAVPAGETTRGTPVAVAANMTTTLRTYFVGPTPNGPWRLVHNAAQLCYD